MDLLDKKILCELDLNCRTPLSQLSKKVNAGRNVVAYRIANLEKEGIIDKYICSVNLGLMGYKTYKVYLKTRGDDTKEKELVKELIQNSQVIHFLKCEGVFDYSITVAVKNITELDDFLMGLKNKFRDLVKDYSVSIVVYSRVFKINKLLLNKKQDILKIERYSGEEKKIVVDEKDKSILRTLSQAANSSVVEIAKKTNLSIDVVKYRLRNLSKHLILSYRLGLDLNKIGYYHYTILLKVRQATKSDENKLIQWCAEKNSVAFCTKRIGMFDFTINVAIKDINEFNEFISELKKEFGSIIDTYDTIINTKLLKLNYVPF